MAVLLDGFGFLRGIADHALAAIALLELPDCTYRYANDAYRRSLTHQGDLIGLRLEDVLPPHTAALARHQFEELSRTGQPGHWRGVFVDLGAGPQAFDYDHFPIPDQDGHLSAALVIAVDATERVRSRTEAEEARRTLDALMEHIPEGITIAHGQDVEIRQISRFGLEMTQRDQAELARIGADRHPDAWQIYHPAAERIATAEELPLTRATRNGEAVRNEIWRLKRSDGTFIPILCNAGPIRDGEGKLTGGVIAWRDVSEIVETEARLRDALATKELLLRELGHRVSNSLQLVTSILSLQASSSPAATKTMLEAARNRITAVGKVHQAIYGQGDGVSVPLSDVVQDVVRAFRDSVDSRLHFVVTTDVTGEVGSEIAVPIGLILNELLTNAAKYAYPAGEGEIRVIVRDMDRTTELSVCDSGRGMPGGKPGRVPGLGMRLIRTLALQLGADFQLQSGAAGTCATLAVPRPDRD